MKNLTEIIAEFEVQHEKNAQEGRPGSWADVPALIELYKEMDRATQDELWDVGLWAFNLYLSETEHSYRNYLRSAKEDRQQAWKDHLDRTEGVSSTLSDRASAQALWWSRGATPGVGA